MASGGEGAGMKLCKECPYFQIKYEPLKAVYGGYWDWGEAACEKHDLVVNYFSHRKINALKCIEEAEP